MEPDNVLIGDISSGIDLPEAQVDEKELIEEKKMAQYSKTAEFERIQNYCQERIAFYQKYFPDGRPVATASKKDREDMWVVANLVIDEFTNLMNIYENAAQAVEQSNA